MNSATSCAGIRVGRPLAIAIIAHVVAPRATTCSPRRISVRRTHDAWRQLSTQVSAISSSPTRTCAT